MSNNREIVDRFFNEARSATSIRHPGIVEIFDFGYLPSGMAFIVMELLDGEPLSKVLVARGRLTEHEALVYTRGIASALSAAHALGIVHRDLQARQHLPGARPRHGRRPAPEDPRLRHRQGGRGPAGRRLVEDPDRRGAGHADDTARSSAAAPATSTTGRICTRSAASSTRCWSVARRSRPRASARCWACTCTWRRCRRRRPASSSAPRPRT
ncbi:MAG: protein kinase [Myxococcales bacterium]|nr:protein kinase [Myxococcales bacterium]